ncbi:hypothetical protein Z517_04682 [Fonsecaea pedrosoi CBS 271.37]|uniref:Major facilitator superfamily (MFS) profile domain-containing protein n=1 Tax=Fonsecaea pedrosoi CBS 271.37 TaxID=1442368 RepID=A0A0D2DUZ2_9EURO|nr:uncharacterized protein Z517_04682 [Fonsecaea pedrosoi CBS 271.37]KIW81656.1 hypothetical protein Z517_04682 [Fonsecaea pedrosoi CBS 271.37]
MTFTESTAAAIIPTNVNTAPRPEAYQATPDVELLSLSNVDSAPKKTGKIEFRCTGESSPDNRERHVRHGCLERSTILKLTSAAFSFFFSGASDGCLGALIPYILRTYDISMDAIAIIYAVTFLGWLVAAASNSHLLQRVGFGAILAIGASLQLLAHILRFWTPPFGLFAATYFLQALGTAYQDSHSNTFVSSVKGAHRWLGFIHAMYSLGCLVSPFVATAVASHVPLKWAYFFIFLLGLGVLNLLAVLYVFSDSLRLLPREQEREQEDDASSHGKDATQKIKETLQTRGVWLLSIFFFFALGAGLTASGWIVEFLVKVRHGNLAQMGYVPAGQAGGVFLGRLLLAEPTFQFGERRMLFLYSVLMLAMQLIFWLVPNLVVDIVAISIFGFFFGPLFAAGISVASRLFPRRIRPTALGFIFTTAQAGGSIFPAITGIVATRAGVKVMQPIVVGLVVAVGVTWLFVPEIKRRED